MLQLSQALINRPVMSLRTGGRIANTTAPIINPNNLKIEGFYCQDSVNKHTLVLLYQDIRDVIQQGIVVDDHDVLVDPNELVRLKDIMKINFELIGKQVVTENKQKVGEVNDYATELETMYIQKLYASQPLLKSLKSGGLSVSRNDILEITSKKIVIRDILRPTPIGNTEPAPAPAVPA